MVYQLSREEILTVCGRCEHFESLMSCCRQETPLRKPLKDIKKCKRWDEFYGGVCLNRG